MLGRGVSPDVARVSATSTASGSSSRCVSEEECVPLAVRRRGKAKKPQPKPLFRHFSAAEVDEEVSASVVASGACSKVRCSGVTSTSAEHFSLTPLRSSDSDAVTDVQSDDDAVFRTYTPSECSGGLDEPGCSLTAPPVLLEKASARSSPPARVMPALPLDDRAGAVAVESRLRALHPDWTDEEIRVERELERILAGGVIR